MPKPTGQLRQITTKCSLSNGHGILKAGNTPGQLSVVRCIEGHREVWPRTMPRGNEVISAQQRHWGKTNSLRQVSHFGCDGPGRIRETWSPAATTPLGSQDGSPFASSRPHPPLATRPSTEDQASSASRIASSVPLDNRRASRSVPATSPDMPRSKAQAAKAAASLASTTDWPTGGTQNVRPIPRWPHPTPTLGASPRPEPEPDAPASSPPPRPPVRG